jgi:autotransporter translocation and assembly factor TamB
LDMKKLLTIPLYLLLLIAVFVGAVVYVYYFTTLPETETNSWLRGFGAKNLGYDISFQKINRDIWNGLRLEGIEITPSGGAQSPIAFISKLNLEFDPMGIARGAYEFSSLKIDSIYARVPENGFSFPKSTQGEKGKSSNLSLSIDNIALGTAVIVLKDGNYVRLDSLKSSFHVKKGILDIAFKQLSAKWPERNVNLNSLSGRIVSEGEGYRLDSLLIDAGGTKVALTGTLGKSFTDNLNLRFTATPFDFADISRILNTHIPGVLSGDGTITGSISDLRGEANLDGTFLNKPFENIHCGYVFSNGILQLNSLTGQIVKADVRASATFDFKARPETYSLSGNVRHLDLRNIGPELKTDFTGKVYINGKGFKEENFAMSLDADLDSVRIENYYFDQVSGPVQFDLKTIHFLSGFTARYKNTLVTGTGYLEYKGDLDITGNADFGDLTNFTGQTFLKELGGRGKAEFHVDGPTIDFNVRASFESDSAWTYGLFPGHLFVKTDLETFISHPVGKVSANWSGGTLYSVATDSGYFHAGVSGVRVFIDSSSADGPVGSFVMKGQYNGTDVPPVFYADTLYGLAAGNTFFSREPIILNVRPAETEFKRFVMGIGTGTIQATGAVSNDLDLNVDVRATGFQIEPIVSQFYHDKDITGIWWGQAKLRGNFDNPQMDFNLEIDSLAVNDTVLGDLHAEFVYRDKYIHTDSTHLESNYGQYYFSGDLPIDLSFAEVKNRLPDKPIDLRLTASGNRLLLSEVFIPSVERFETDFTLGMKLGGTYSKPTITGQGKITNGTLKILDLVDPLTNVNAYLRMENETIYIDSLTAAVHGGQEWTKMFGEIISARLGSKPAQMVRASGTIKLITLGIFAYSIDASGKNFYFQSDAYDVKGLADFNVKVVGENIPTVRGSVTLRRLEILDEFDRFVTPEYNPNIVLEDSTLWNLDLAIKGVNNIWINNSDLNAELKGDLHVERQLGIMTILGELDIIRGTYNLLGQRFQFQSGTMQFQNVSTVNPNINFVVTTKLRNVPNQGVSPVDLNITGTLLEPAIGVGSGSVVTNEDLLKYLVTGSQVNPLGSSQTGLSNFSQSLISSLSSTIPTFIPGLRGAGLFEELDIYPTPSGTQLSLAKYLSRSLSISYSQNLTTNQQQLGRTIGVEYYLNNNLSVNVSQGTQSNQQNTQYEGISFDLNLNFEY